MNVTKLTQNGNGLIAAIETGYFFAANDICIDITLLPDGRVLAIGTDDGIVYPDDSGHKHLDGSVPRTILARILPWEVEADTLDYANRYYPQEIESLTNKIAARERINLAAGAGIDLNMLYDELPEWLVQEADEWELKSLIPDKRDQLIDCILK